MSIFFIIFMKGGSKGGVLGTAYLSLQILQWWCGAISGRRTALISVVYSLIIFAYKRGVVELPTPHNIVITRNYNLNFILQIPLSEYPL